MKRARVELSRGELCALLLALVEVEHRNGFHANTQRELARARAELARALGRACVPRGGELVNARALRWERTHAAKRRQHQRRMRRELNHKTGRG